MVRKTRAGHDFDGDGQAEVYTVELDVVYLSEVDGSVVLRIEPEFGTTTGTFADSVDVADTDGNGMDDLVFGADGGGEVFYVRNPLDCLP